MPLGFRVDVSRTVAHYKTVVRTIAYRRACSWKGEAPPDNSVHRLRTVGWGCTIEDAERPSSAREALDRARRRPRRLELEGRSERYCTTRDCRLAGSSRTVAIGCVDGNGTGRSALSATPSWRQVFASSRRRSSGWTPRQVIDAYRASGQRRAWPRLCPVSTSEMTKAKTRIVTCSSGSTARRAARPATSAFGNAKRTRFRRCKKYND